MKTGILTIGLLAIIAGFVFLNNTKTSERVLSSSQSALQENDEDKGGLETPDHPLQVEYMRKQEYPGSEILIEQTLPKGSNYSRSIASYKSDGLKQYALLTIPDGVAPETGWPVIIFNHGYIDPKVYRTTEKYIAYTDYFSRAGYIVFKPDYRGHGNSEGNAEGGYGSPAYTIDVLNAVASIKRFNDQLSSGNKVVDINRIGMWGHSMGGSITLRAMVVSKDIKAGVIWAGVVGSYPDLVYNWRRRDPNLPTQTPPPVPTQFSQRGRWRNELIVKYGDATEDNAFWQSISPTSYLSDISGPLELHHGTADTSVPVSMSEKLQQRMEAAGKVSETFIYQADDHNIAGNFSLAMRRSLEFFDKNVKGE